MDIKDFCYGKAQKGEVGIEIEVEGTDLPLAPEGWTIHDEGSLRGESCEYVLTKPIMRKSVKRYLSRIRRAYIMNKTEVIHSTRQSVHVHINVQDLSVPQAYRFMILFLTLEIPLVSWCGDSREDNLFCLKGSTARGLISALEDAATPDTFVNLDTETLRYSAMNVISMFKFGSIEFRSMEGTDDMKRIETWVNTLLALKDAAKKYESAFDIITDISALGHDLFLDKVLGKSSHVVTSSSTWKEDLTSSMRELQYLIYQTDWSALERPKVVKEIVVGEPDWDRFDPGFGLL